MSRPRVAWAVAVALGITAIVATAAIGASGRAPQRRTALKLSGHVGDLVPGVRRELTIHVRNRSGRRLHLRSVTTHVRAAGPRCGSSVIHVAPFRGNLLIAAGGSRRVRVTVSMRPNSPSACEGAVFPLAFRAFATAR